MIRIITIIALLFITACASTPQPGGLTPEPGPVKEPSNAQLQSAIQSYVASIGGPAATGFEFNRIDLNNDRRREGLVMLKRPYGYWCETNGCRLLIFKANEDSFTFTSIIKPIREPIYVAKAQNNNWKNIVTRVSGRSNKAKNVALKFNGNTYPKNPSDLPPLNARFMNNPNYTRVFN